MARNNFNVYCRPVSVSIVGGISKSNAQWSKNIVAIAVAVTWATGVTFLSFDYLLVTTAMKGFPDIAFGNRPSTVMTTYFNSPEGGTGEASFVICGVRDFRRTYDPLWLLRICPSPYAASRNCCASYRTYHALLGVPPASNMVEREDPWR